MPLAPASTGTRTMTTLVEEHVLYRIFNAPVREYPYPHIYVEDVFPDDFYSELRANWPDSSAFKPLAETEIGRAHV